MLANQPQAQGIMEKLAQDSRGESWYAVLDAAQDPHGPDRARDADLRVESLYAGELGDLASAAAPHLAVIAFDTPFSRWFAGDWDSHLGIVLQSSATFDEVRNHFRRFLLVKDESGRKFRFRFYDPRVLRAFLPACSRDELTQFFGPIGRFFAPARDGNAVLAFSLRGGRLSVVQLGGSP